MKSLINTVSPNAADMIRMDHSHVLTAFHQYSPHAAPSARRAIVNSICMALEIHAQLEEEIFYPAVRLSPEDTAQVDKNVPEHAEMKRLIAQLRQLQPVDPAFDRTLLELMRDVIHHVADEETVLLPDAERLLGEARLRELGGRMTRRRIQLTAPRAGELISNSVRAMPTSYLIAASVTLLAGAYVLKRSLAPRT